MSLFINYKSSINEIPKEEIKKILNLKNKIKFSLKVPKYCQILSKEMKLIVSGNLEENYIFDNSTIVLSIIKEPLKCRKNKKKLKYKNSVKLKIIQIFQLNIVMNVIHFYVQIVILINIKK
jgi:hypothetical protein